MNIVSYNIRGLRRGVKWAAIRRMVRKQKVDMICIHETKRELIDKAACQALWGDSDVGWEFQLVINTAGGLLCVWNQQAFKLERRETGSGFILLEGVWIQENQKTSVVNLYSPCDVHQKRIQWDSLKLLRQQDPDGLWCFMGDFNNIRYQSEREGVSHRGTEATNINDFNNWIAELELEEIPCVGKRFTWFRPNGAAKSRLDRFLVSPKWLHKWPACTNFTLERNFSDHCPIMLRAKVIDWGSKPFRVFDCWFKDKSFQKVVRECWTSNQPRGWGGFALKVKLKRLKEALKVWNRDHYGDTLKKVQQIEADLNRLEDASSTRQLTQQEMTAHKNLQEELWTTALSHESLMRQKAGVKWLRERDCNSRYFHVLMNSRRTNNAIKGVFIDGAWVDDPVKVK